MGRLHFRAIKTARAAHGSAIDHVVLASVLTLTLCWVIYFLIVVTTASCVAAIGYLLGESRYAPPLLDMFTLAFCAAGALWFVNLVRVRQGRQSYWVRAFELILLSFGLLTVLTWNEHIRPRSPSTEVTESIREGLLRLPPFRVDWYFIEEAPRDFDLFPARDEQGRTFHEAYLEGEFGAPIARNADFPLGLFMRPAEECPCLNLRDRENNLLRHQFEWTLEYADLDAEFTAHYTAQLDALPERVEQPEWCESALSLARYR